MPQPNQQFRQWTRGTSFVLAMGKTQVAALVSAHVSKDRKHYLGFGHKLLKNWVVAVNGLVDRGLLVFTDFGREHNKKTTGEIFRVTEAGEHVVALLQVSGIYQELVDEFNACDKRVRLHA